jgi:exodeoxyribonuclease VII small subunit
MKDMSFEKALKELEETVEKLENGELSLDESLTLFEKGVQLTKFLRKELEKAEKKIDILLKDKEGKVKTEPFELTEEDKTSSDKTEGTDSGENNDLPF